MRFSVLLLFLSKRVRDRRLLVVIVSTVLLAAGIWGANLKAEWSIVDDHEIHHFLGKDHKMGWGEIPGTLLQTEVGNVGHSVRYRPAYYLLRLMECAVFGDHVHSWYLFRIVIYALFIAALWLVLSRYGSFWYVSVTTILVALQPFWKDVFGRLGPAEIYAALGAALFLLGWSLYDSSTVRPRSLLDSVAPLAVLAGGVTLVGVKENMAVVLLPVLIWLYFLGTKDKRPWGIISSLVLVSLFSVFIAGAIAYGLVRQGSDVYGQDISMLSRVRSMMSGIRGVNCVPIIVWVLSCGLAWVVLSWLRKVPAATGRPQCGRSIAWSHLTLQTALLAGYLIQVLFYNGRIPIGGRYDFPGVVILIVSMFFFGSFLSWLLIAWLGCRKLAWAGQALMLGCIMWLFPPKPVELRTAVQENVNTTRSFTHSLMELVNSAKAAPASTVILVSHSQGDYEPVFSVQRYLTAFGVANPLSLRLMGYASADMDEPFWRKLVVELEGLAGGGKGFLAFSHEMEEDCLAVVLSSGKKYCRQSWRLF